MRTSSGRARFIIDWAHYNYRPIRAVFGCFSGGHDSLTACHIAAQHPKFTAMVHINTGIGVPETREFVYETCRREGWPLLEYRAWELSRPIPGQETEADLPRADPISLFRALCLKWGFPGPPGHRVMFNRLKERGLEALVREHKQTRGDHFVLVTGGRSQESTRRMGNVEPMQKRGARLWCAIIHDWSKRDCNEYLARHNIPRNPVVDTIHKSGECLCGAFAIPPNNPYTGERGEEFRELELWYPETAAKIRALEREVRAAGFPWNWDERAPKWFEAQKRGQEFLFEMSQGDEFQPLCIDCPSASSSSPAPESSESPSGQHP